MRKTTNKKKSTKTLLKKAWELMSEYTRRKNASSSGQAACVTCGKKDHWKNLQAGHFVPRGAGGPKPHCFDERNIHPQCCYCNTFNAEEAHIRYTQFIIDNFGEDTIDDLIRLRKTPHKWTVGEVEGLIDSLKDKIERL